MRPEADLDQAVDRLAQILSVAAVVDTALIREARVTLLPGSPAAVEGQLFFSDLVVSRGRDGIILSELALGGLRTSLQRQPWFRQALDLVEKSHQQSNSLIRMEERLIRSALLAQPQSARQIEDAWREVLAWMQENAAQARNIARWLLRAGPRFPAEALVPDLAQKLLWISRFAVQGQTLRRGEQRPADADLALLRQIFGFEKVGVRLLEDAVEFSRPPVEGAETVDVLDSSPMRLYLFTQPSGEDERDILLSPGVQAYRLAGEPEVVGLRNQMNDVYELRRGGPPTEPQQRTDWYRDAIFYEVAVRSFADSTGSGSGDLRGLIQQVTYIRSVGADTLVLLPFQPAPASSGGYLVTDHRQVDPELGTRQDFTDLLRAAADNGLRVVVDLVLDHTSVEHRWFQASSREPEGEYGAFYRWRELTQHELEMGEPDLGNAWVSDVAPFLAYATRFGPGAAELNLENPAVRNVLKDIVRFWLDLGVDGVRVVGPPHPVVTKEGTIDGVPPASNDLVAEIREMIDRHHPGRVVLLDLGLAWKQPDRYFGTAQRPEAHIVVPGRYGQALLQTLAGQGKHRFRDWFEDLWVTQDSRFQWGTNLRGFDSYEEHRRMARQGYSELDMSPRARVREGLSRRLALRTRGSLAQTELLYALMLSLPGSPVLRYGDEIGMGEDPYLRHWERAFDPMQWSPRANGEFVVGGPMLANVDSQTRDLDSLLNRVRNLIIARREYPVFGGGAFHVVHSADPSVLAYLRQERGPVEGNTRQSVLCVANLTGAATATTLTLRPPDGTGSRLRSILGGSRLGELPDDGQLTVTLGPSGYYWILLSPLSEGEPE